MMDSMEISFKEVKNLKVNLQKRSVRPLTQKICRNTSPQAGWFHYQKLPHNQ